MEKNIHILEIAVGLIFLKRRLGLLLTLGGDEITPGDRRCLAVNSGSGKVPYKNLVNFLACASKALFIQSFVRF